MRLTNFCDYSLRVLIFLAVKNEKSSIPEISKVYKISKNHVIKVVHNLAKLGYIHSMQGKNGGIRLALLPERINIGKVVEEVEPDFDLLECFGQRKDHCCISPVCRLKGFFRLAQKAFLDTLKNYSIADIIKNRGLLLSLTMAIHKA